MKKPRPSPAGPGGRSRSIRSAQTNPRPQDAGLSGLRERCTDKRHGANLRLVARRVKSRSAPAMLCDPLLKQLAGARDFLRQSPELVGCDLELARFRDCAICPLGDVVGDHHDAGNYFPDATRLVKSWTAHEKIDNTPTITSRRSMPFHTASSHRICGQPKSQAGTG